MFPDSALGARFAQELNGTPAFNLIHPDFHQLVRARIKNSTEHNVSAPLAEMKFIRVDGTVMDVESQAAPIIYNGTPSMLVVFRDITERKQMQDALGNSEKGMNDAQRYAHLGSWIWDVNANQFTGSDEVYRIFGLDKDSFSGNLADLITLAVHPEDRDNVSQVIREVIKQGKPIPTECRVILKDGTTRIVLTEAGEIILDEQGKPAIIHGIVRDITEHKLAENQRALEQREKEALINNTNDLIWSVSKDYKLIAGNKAFFDNVKDISRATLTSGDHLLSKKMFSPEQIIFWESIYKKVLSGETLQQDFHAAATENSPSSWLELTFNPIWDGNEVAGVACFGKDISKRKQAEEALRKSEENLKKAQRYAHLGSWVWDVKTNQVAWSDEMYQIFGIDKGSFSGDLADVISRTVHPEDLEKVNQVGREVTRQGKPIPIEYRVIWQDGTIRTVWTEAGEISLDEQGEPATISGIVQDISERKQAEADILNELDRLRSDFIGNISHELNNPLGIILVMVTALRKTELHLDDETTQGFLRDIEIETHSLQGIVDDLLDISRFQNKGLELKLAQVNISERLKRIIKIFAAKDSGHIFKLETPSTALEAYIDAKRIEQVLRNLLDNAIKFSPVGTIILVTAEMEESSICIKVSDEGRGIPITEHQNIFKRFYRIVDKNAAHVRGLGLGLSICHDIVTAHGGNLWVDNASQRGSVFSLTLPLLPQQEIEHE